MRALVLDDFWKLGVHERPDPVPGPGEVVLRIVATGICGSDLHGFTGDTGRRRPGQVMGHETVGRIESVGPGVALPVGAVATMYPVLACGDCPVCDAGAGHICPRRTVIGVDPARSAAFADRLLVPAANVVPLSADLPVELGALIEPLAVGYHAARRGGVGAQDRVLVLGGGPIGQAAVLAAERLGAEAVAVTEPDEDRGALVGALGATVLRPGDGLAERVAGALGGPATVAIDAVGVTGTLADAVAATGPGARVVLVGMGAPRVELAAFALSTEERTLLGSFCYSLAEFRDTATWAGTVAQRLTPLVSEQVPVVDAAAAFTRLARQESTASKILVRFDEEGSR